MLELITKKISNKIIFSLLVLMTLSSLAVVFFTTTKVSDDSLVRTKESLEMLNTAMFQSLRNAMNSGDPVQIKKAEDDARGIKGVKNLTVAKSKPLIEMYSPDTKFTKDPNILKAFDSKEPSILETNNNNGHNLRMIKPMVATSECLLCHANQNEGDVIGVMDLTFSLDEADEQLSDLVIDILLISTVLGWITIGLVLFIVKRATNPIAKLKEGFQNLLTSNDPNIQLSVSSKDEIGEVSNLFNSYMHKVREGIKKDELVIDEATDVLHKISNGFFVYQVQAKASNPHVEHLKNSLNDMIASTKDTIDSINDTLKNYSESKFDYKINDKGIYGNLGTLTSGIKLVGNNTSEILAITMNIGNSLNENTETLSSASNNLSVSSNQQAASLEETAAALEEITANIQANTQATVRMSQLAQKVTSSAQSGHKLADETASAMDEINEKVSSINEAIEVIDQIAFQTNILSLNAAVEAATAGEAGKGFAVVAQEVRNLAARSAEAAKEIKDIVELATSKANHGKTISDNMIKGYEELNENITKTITTIDEVANASREQERGIVQINDAVNTLDQATQKNAQVAEQISSMSANISNMSTSLVTAASRASFMEDSKDKVCDVDLVYDTAKLKVELLNIKDRLYAKLGTYSEFSIEKNSTIENWITSHINSGKKVDMKLMEDIKKLNNDLNIKLNEFVRANAAKADNTQLSAKAKDIEINTLQIFGSLNNVKREACK